jgi:hypothetical protein
MTDVSTDTRITHGLLRALDVCGSYTDRFAELFPTADHPDGVEPTRDVCVANAVDFDWHWAMSAMLTSDAQRTFGAALEDGDAIKALRAEREVVRGEYRTALDEWRDKFNQGDDYPGYNASQEVREANQEVHRGYNERIEQLNRREREVHAATFAELYADPTNHSIGLVQARSRADEYAEVDDRRRLSDAERRVERVRRQITEYETSVRDMQRQVQLLQEQLPRYEEALTQVRAEVEPRVAVRERRRAAHRAAHARRRVEELKTSLAEAERLAAEAAAQAESDVVSTGSTTDA